MNFELIEILDRTILYGYRGSIAHGMYVPPDDPNSIDDRDMMGICVAPPECYLGLQQFEQKESFVGQDDVVIYEIRKMFRLLLKGNPNVLSLLWLEPNHYLKVEPAGRRILANRDIFVSKSVYHSFVGYADGQFKRMTHYKCFGYMGAKRKALVDKFGYDTKNAAHLIRLLRMGIEFLTEGKLYVLRQDAKELLEIKRGKWKLEEVQAQAKQLFELAREAYVRSPLPAHPKTKEAEALLMSIVSDYVGREMRLREMTERV